MIKSFKHKGLKRFFETGSKSGIQAKHAEKLSLILAFLNASKTVEDMNLPAFRLHSLSDTRADIWSVCTEKRVGDKRVSFASFSPLALCK